MFLAFYSLKLLFFIHWIYFTFTILMFKWEKYHLMCSQLNIDIRLYRYSGASLIRPVLEFSSVRTMWMYKYVFILYSIYFFLIITLPKHLRTWGKYVPFCICVGLFFQFYYKHFLIAKNKIIEKINGFFIWLINS